MDSETTRETSPSGPDFVCPSCGGTTFTARLWTLGFSDAYLVADERGDARLVGYSDFTEVIYDEQRWTAVVCAKCEHDIAVPDIEMSADLDLSGDQAAALARAIETSPGAMACLGAVVNELRRVAAAPALKCLPRGVP